MSTSGSGTGSQASARIRASLSVGWRVTKIITCSSALLLVVCAEIISALVWIFSSKNLTFKKATSALKINSGAVKVLAKIIRKAVTA